MESEWMTLSQAAKKHGITREAMRQAVKNNRIEWNGKTGRECRVRGPLAEPVRNTVTGSDIADLAGAKLENLKRDAILKDQRIKENREAQWRAYADATCEDYLAAFAPLSAKLTEMRLPAPKLAALRKTVEECTAEFLRRQKKRYEEHEPENA